MDERSSLLSHVLGDPSDDTARLVLADWLEEHSEEDLARFLRAGVVAARYSTVAIIDDPHYYAALRAMSDIAAAGIPTRWLSRLDIGPNPLAPGDWAWDNSGDRLTVRLGSSVGVFRRGLLAELELKLSEWYAIAERVLAACPLECVRVTDVPGLSFTFSRSREGWQINGQVRLPRQNFQLTGITLPAAIAPSAILTMPSTEWSAEQLFPDRTAMVAAVVGECVSLASELREAAGDQWPRPVAGRRRP